MALSSPWCELRARISTWPRKAGLSVGFLSLIASTTDVTLAAHDKRSMRVVEGEVIAIGQQVAEGDLEVLQARLHSTRDGGSISLLIAPTTVCDQIEFTIEPGDHIRARVFMDDTRSFRVQNIHNLTRGTMVRLRTLREIPLWDVNGSWQGGPVRSHWGRHRHGSNRPHGGS